MIMKNKPYLTTTCYERSKKKMGDSGGHEMPGESIISNLWRRLGFPSTMRFEGSGNL